MKINHRIIACMVAGALVTGCSKPPSSETAETDNSTTAENSILTQFLPALPNPPSAKKVPHEFTHHGITIEDPWFWLRDTSYPDIDDEEILSYLNSENDYFEQWLTPYDEFKNTIFVEMKGRMDETETSVPVVSNGYEYKWEFLDGKEYRTHSRRPAGTDSEWQVYLDIPTLAEAYDYFDLGDYAISPDNQFMAYSVNTDGSERYTVTIVNLATGEKLGDSISGTSGSVLFTKDNSLIYGKLQEERWWVKAIHAHTLGTPVEQDRLLLTESDPGFFMGFSETSDSEYLIIGSGQGEVSEAYVIPQSDLSVAPVLLASRDMAFSYSFDHAHGKFWIIANDLHVNFRLASVDAANPYYENWQTELPGSDDVYIKSLQTFDNFMAIKRSESGLDQLVLVDYEGKETFIDFPESVYTADFVSNPEFSQPHVRVNYASMITPDTVFDYQLAEQKLKQRKVRAIPSGYDKTQYQTKRIMIDARDGAKVPVTLMYHTGTKLDGSNPMHLYAYGAYGFGMPPYFSSNRLSLVDRGLVYAIAHIRGGDDMGYQWYLDGKLEKRDNTFNDFVDAATALIDQGYTSAGNISISGASAGGKLMGAVVNQAPELWSSVILAVPFVDVLNTMLDATLPLTPPEWKEWGNPIEDKAAFELISSYSPYDNITASEYPPMLVTGGLNDPRVTYWEPAKWTAKMRDMKTDDHLLVMRMNMGAGHFANSGRYGRQLDSAEEMVFTLISHGITE